MIAKLLEKSISHIAQIKALGWATCSTKKGQTRLNWVPILDRLFHRVKILIWIVNHQTSTAPASSHSVVIRLIHVVLLLQDPRSCLTRPRPNSPAFSARLHLQTSLLARTDVNLSVVTALAPTSRHGHASRRDLMVDPCRHAHFLKLGG